MKRYLESFLLKDLQKKIVLLTGPRQTGKTTLSKMLKGSFDYFNFDNPEHRLALLDRSWDRAKDLVIFDELHKLKNWKSWLKGVYDTESIPPAILVTGSAKFDTYKKVGDSLAGRFFQFRLHPLDLKEIRTKFPEDHLETSFEKLLNIGGFPEPFLNGTQRYYNRWKKSHLDIILKQDLLDLENVQHISVIETLIQLLRRRVGSPVSYNSLARDLQVSDKTVKRWLTILENMYVVFRVTPFHRNVARSILKAPKFYFYDTGQVIGDDGVKFENLTACSLLKEIHYCGDCFGDDLGLYFLRTKEGKEMDFFVTADNQPVMMVEVKWSDERVGTHFSHFERFFTGIKMVQIVRNLDREKSYPNGLEVRSGVKWLSQLSLASKPAAISTSYLS